MALLVEIDNIKNQRNLIVHGMWGEIHGIAAVGSLRTKPNDPNNVIYEDWPPTRIIAFADQTPRCLVEALRLVERIECAENRSGDPPWVSPSFCKIFAKAGQHRETRLAPVDLTKLRCLVDAESVKRP
jgi:hypothetical protein